MSKGSTPRPIQVSNEEYAQRWDLIFGRDKQQDEDYKKGFVLDMMLIDAEKDEDENLDMA